MHYAGLSCAEFKMRLDEVLDARRQPDRDQQLRDHARRCAKCAQWMDDHKVLLATVGEIAGESPRPDFSFQVLQAVEIQQRQQRRRVWRAALLALAAGLLIAAVGWRIPRGSQLPQELANEGQPPTFAYASIVVDLASSLTTKPTRLAGEVAEGFKPVTSSVYTALHTLWRTLPGSESAQKVL